MPALFVFLLKVNVALLLFCAGYYLALRHLTFYTLNRIYLVTAILFASIYPQVNFSEFAQHHQQLAKPVQAVAINWQTPAASLIGPINQPVYWQWITIAFWAGAILLLLRLLLQLLSLIKLHRASTAQKIHNHNVRIIDGNAGPFSFWKSIYVNPANHKADDLKAILLHEQVHVNEWHTLDVLLAELSTIFYWFNPGIWLLKKAIRENIEFITDRKILNKGVDTKQYQYSLINVSFAAGSNNLVNHFNISTIKKRIIMMNAKKSSKFNLTRYAFLVPAVIVSLFIFSITKAAFNKKSTVIKKTVINLIKAGDGTPIIKIKKTNKVELSNTIVKQKKAADTVKNVKITATSPARDSVLYIINGVKANKSNFRALDPDNICSLSMLPAEQANKIIDGLDTKTSVLFVTTNDSETGKNLKEKIDKLVNSQYTIKNDGYFRGPITVSGRLSYSKMPASADTATKKAYSLKKSKFKGNTVRLTYDSISGDAVGLGISSRKTADVLLGQPDSVEVKSFKLGSETNASGVLVYRLEPVKQKIAVKKLTTFSANSKAFWSTHTINENSINYIADKLILIDGKEASAKELKKLSVAEIKSISINSRDETKQYGEKAKNGVVKISTKEELTTPKNN